MGWFSDLFKTKNMVEDSGLPKVSNIPPMPNVKPCKPEKDISEPVYAIVKAMQERPSSFKVKIDNKLTEKSLYEAWVFDVTDIKTNQKVRVARAYGYKCYRYSIAWDWLTEDETQYLGKEAEVMYTKKYERLKNMQRAAMKAIYK